MSVASELAENGFASIPGYLDDNGLRQFAGLLDVALGGPPDSGKEFTLFKDPSMRDQKLAGTVMGWADRIGKLLSAAPYSRLTDEFVVKRHGESAVYPWHQDGAFFSDEKLVTAVLWLSAARKGEGTLAVVPGSHKQGRRPHVKGAGFVQIADDPRDAWTELDLAAGTLVLVHHDLVHRGTANLSDREIRTFSLILTPRTLT